ncbi:unnamed protein product [Rhodiola kirilowii]
MHLPRSHLSDSQTFQLGVAALGIWLLEPKEGCYEIAFKTNSLLPTEVFANGI